MVRGMQGGNKGQSIPAGWSIHLWFKQEMFRISLLLCVAECGILMPKMVTVFQLGGREAESLPIAAAE